MRKTGKIIIDAARYKQEEYADKLKWHRKSERESQSVPLPTAGEKWTWDTCWKITYDRVVVRAGYLYSPTDLQPPELNELVVKLMTKQRGISEDALLRTVDWLERDYYDSSLLPEYRRRSWMDAWHFVLRRWYRTTRADWLVGKNKELIDKGFPELPTTRCFWYVKLPQPITSHVDGIVTRHCGKYYPPYGDYEDYTDGGLEDRIQQRLYLVNGGWDSRSPLGVHPLDVKEVIRG